MRLSKNRRIKPGIILVIGAMMIVAVGSFAILTKPKPFIYLQHGIVEQTIDARFVVVRDEQVLSAENYGRIVHFASEGELVKKNAVVAEIYLKAYNDVTLHNFYSLQQQILEYQQDNIIKNVVDVDLQQINAKIEDKMNALSSVMIEKQHFNVLQLENELSELLLQKQKYLEQLAQPDSNLMRLYEQRDVLQEKIESWKVKIQAPQDGYVSFYFDGCEDVLKPDNIKKMKYNDILHTLNNTLANGAIQTQPMIPFVRIVNPQFANVLVLSDKNKPRIEIGTSYYFRLDALPGQTLQATAEQKMTERNYTVDVLKVNKDVLLLLSVRDTKGVVVRKAEGLKVPVSSIKTKDDQLGVFTVNEEGRDIAFVEVDVVLYDNNNQYAIVSSKTKDALQVHQRIKS